MLVRDGTGRCADHKRQAWAKKPNATKRITGRRLQSMRSALFKRNPLCIECEKHHVVRLATQRDHIIPLTEGGKDDDSNTQGLCEECHEAKSLAEALRSKRKGW